MALRAKVLQKKAEKFELKKLQFIEVTKERLSIFDTLLEDVYANRRPKPTEYSVRKDLIRVFNEIAKEIYGNSNDIPVVVEFGSFVMDLFSTTSDLDLSVNFSTSAFDFPREKKIQTLRKFARKLYSIQRMGHVYGVLPITTAKVPILKCVDRGTGVECDISVENRDGITKSHIIRIISSIDERFKKLSFLLKTWAKAHNINSSRDKTLNSLSIILLVAFHLQTRNPPILPPFSVIFRDGNDPATVAKSIPNFANYGKRNRESLAELFITLLLKLSSVEKLWAKGLCASTSTASWISKTWETKVASISVEDFTDRSQNVARAVGVLEVKQIYKCIDNTIRDISAFMNEKIGLKLKDLLFGGDGGIPISIPSLPRVPNRTRAAVTGKRKRPGTGSSFRNRKESRRATQPVESWSTKKMRADEGWRGLPYGTSSAARVEPTSSRGWDETREGGRERANRPAGWDRIEQAEVGGWDETREGGREQANRPAGWDRIEQAEVGGWEEAYRQREWRAKQQVGGGWGRWGGTQQTWDHQPYTRWASH